ncbi:hypothetical protein [Niabella drilacis]|uniref:Uncharacterized protein n=1 Tax=Niabella drilacis (strain DSM 25811 / CCM 8410 / CCUG 62505 / LMG 26954 / E90) TaxID=1285928 RepID=A0A1G6RDF5_NIADE|nr:hypothetical protein [Niabella drilacis]SDD02670.1 hypothetical protein SAMN04487894_105244 [Niabella drilacis]
MRFLRETGIAVQVARFSGRVWIQTTDTDVLTLELQNRKGNDDSRAVAPDGPQDSGLQEQD